MLRTASCLWFLLWLMLFLAACGSSPSESEAVPTTSDTATLPATTARSPTAVEHNIAITPALDVESFAEARERMVEEGIVGLGITDEAVVEAMRNVPRHEFVPDNYLAQAYNNHPLPIGHGQTISQPYIVALMTEAVGVDADDRVLEIGTGSGYQAAVLAEIVDQVETVEIIEPLAESAEKQLETLGYENVNVHHADGYFGWEQEAPYDAILVTAAPDHIPQPLVQQLKIGGEMVIPVGPVGGYQTLWLVTRTSEDEVRTEALGDVQFVPFTRDE
ncbi:MAG: protein-L-isoaspartate(D-aspartate) O-methyltransferase [Chloroflexota bacterium]|nr:protein-L-isoaspartate(D-aspartate) O-methyltransferase [Chloroflexota bacterium]